MDRHKADYYRMNHVSRVTKKKRKKQLSISAGASTRQAACAPKIMALIFSGYTALL